MTKLKKNPAIWVYVICAVLLLALVVTQFLPFWTADEDSSSISGLLWLASSHKGVNTMIVKSMGGALTLSNFAWAPALVLVLSVLGIVLCALRFKAAILVALVALLSGLVGMYQYLAMPIFQIGANWTLHLVASILVVVGALASLALVILAKIKKAK